jgi:putative peptidoglycan lipid II flippase
LVKAIVNKHKSLLSSLIQLVITALTFVFGVLMAKYFGASSEMDAYVVSATIISIVYALVTSVQSKVVIPYVNSLEFHDEKRLAIATIINFNTWLFLFIGVLFYLGSSVLMETLAPGLGMEEKNIGATLLRISSVYLIFANFGGLGKAVIEMNFNPVLSQLFRLFQVLVLLSSLLLLNYDLGIFSLPSSHVISVVLSVPLYLFYLKKNDYSTGFGLKLWNSHVKKYLILLFPILIGQILMRTIKLSDSFLASFLEEGALSQINYTLRIVMNLDQLFMGVFIVYFPLLAKLNGPKDNEEHLSVFLRGFRVLFLGALALTCFLLVFSEDIIKVVFERGAFTNSDTKDVSNLMRAYGLMILCSPLGNYFANTYYSRGASKLATIYSVLSSVMNIVLNFIFVYYWGIYGLAFASSLAYLLGNVLQSFNLSKVNSAFRKFLLLKEVLLIALALSPGVVLMLWLNTLDQFSSLKSFWELIFKLSLCGVLYILLALATAYLMKMDFVRRKNN